MEFSIDVNSVTTIKPSHILLVEDDASLAEWITQYLRNHGHLVTHVARGDLVAAYVERHLPDLIILDILLPGKNGFEVCRDIRPNYHGPLLMLTACTDETDEVRGLELGANDYLEKPVRPRVLLARINALLRRETASTQMRLVFGELHLNLAAKSVSFKGKPIAVTANEFDVLWLLATHAGQIVSRDALVSKLRGIDYDGFDRSIDIRISRLRKKLLDDPAHPVRIRTIRAQGYLFAPDAWN